MDTAVTLHRDFDARTSDKMALMQSAHGRHKAQRLAAARDLAAGSLHCGDGRELFHAANGIEA